MSSESLPSGETACVAGNVAQAIGGHVVAETTTYDETPGSIRAAQMVVKAATVSPPPTNKNFDLHTNREGLAKLLGKAYGNTRR